MSRLMVSLITVRASLFWRPWVALCCPSALHCIGTAAFQCSSRVCFNKATFVHLQFWSVMQLEWPQIRVRPRFSDQVGHETMFASSGNKHFFTKSCYHQTYQNYEQSRQKLGTILGNKVSWKSKFSKTFFNKSWSSSQIFFKEFFFGKVEPIFNTEKWLWKYEFWDVQGGCS